MYLSTHKNFQRKILDNRIEEETSKPSFRINGKSIEGEKFIYKNFFFTYTEVNIFLTNVRSNKFSILPTYVHTYIPGSLLRILPLLLLSYSRYLHNFSTEYWKWRTKSVWCYRGVVNLFCAAGWFTHKDFYLPVKKKKKKWLREL